MPSLKLIFLIIRTFEPGTEGPTLASGSLPASNSVTTPDRFEEGDKSRPMAMDPAENGAVNRKKSTSPGFSIRPGWSEPTPRSDANANVLPKSSDWVTEPSDASAIDGGSMIGMG